MRRYTHTRKMVYSGIIWLKPYFVRYLVTEYGIVRYYSSKYFASLLGISLTKLLFFSIFLDIFLESLFFFHC